MRILRKTSNVDAQAPASPRKSVKVCDEMKQTRKNDVHVNVIDMERSTL